MAKSDPAYERLGAKVLSLPDVIAQSVGFMGPVFSSAFVIPPVVGVRMMAVGSVRSFADAPGRAWLLVSAVLAVLITGGAIFGSFYKVTSPTILAPWFALAVLVIGFASTFVARARRSASTQLPDLSKSTA